MKKLCKLLGIIALVAVIGFSMITCSSGGGGGGSPANTPQTETPGGSSAFVTYTGMRTVSGTDYLYVLIIEESGAARAAYTPAEGDNYTLIYNAYTYVDMSTGTVESVEDGVLTLAPKGNQADIFTATVSGTGITGMTGTIKFDEGNQLPAPAELNSPSASSNSEKSIAIIGITGLTGDAAVIVRPKDNSDNFVAGNENGEITNGVIFIKLTTASSGWYTGSVSEYVVVAINNKDWYITKEKISITQAVTVIPWSSFGKWE